MTLARNFVKLGRNFKFPRLDKEVAIYFILSIIIAIGLILRLYNLGDKSLWLDEIFSVTQSKEEELYFGGSPTFYAILHPLITYLGTSEFVVRFPSVIFGILAILLTYKVGKMLFGVNEGAISAFLLSISVFAIRYSQEARMYSLFMFMALASLFFFYRAIQKNEKIMWVGFVVSTVLSVYTHFYALFVIFAETILFVLFVLIEKPSPAKVDKRIRRPLPAEVGRKTFLAFFSSLAIIFIAITPVLSQTLTLTSGEPWTWIERPTVSFLLSMFNAFSVGSIYFPTEFEGMLALGVFLFFFLIGILVSIKKFRKQITLLLLWIFFPITTAFIVSFLFFPILGHPRYVIFTLPPYLILISTGITFTINRAVDFASSINVKALPAYLILTLRTPRLKKGRRKKKNEENIRLATCFILGALVFGSVSTPLLETYFKDQGENWKGAANYLNNNIQPGDVIVVEPEYTTICLAYYYNANLTKTTLISSNGTLQKLQKICDENPRVWFVSSPHIQYTDLDGKIRGWVDKNFKLVVNFGSVYVYFRKAQVKT